MKKNKKGELNALGMIIIMAVTLIVGVVLFQVIAQSVGNSTSTVSVVNKTLAQGVNGTAQYLDYRSLSDVVVLNATNGTTGFTTNAMVLGSGNYTVTNNVINPTTGALAVSITPSAGLEYIPGIWRVSGTAQPTTYIAESAGRAIAGLIVVMFALALAVVAMTPALRNDFMNLIGK